MVVCVVRVWVWHKRRTKVSWSSWRAWKIRCRCWFLRRAVERMKPWTSSGTRRLSAVLSWGLFPLHHWNHSFRGLLLFVCLQGSRCWLEEPVRVCSVQPEQHCRWRPGGRRGGGVGTSGDAGGRHQRAAESGGQRRSCAGLQPLLSSHRLLTAEGESVTSRQ